MLCTYELEHTICFITHSPSSSWLSIASTIHCIRASAYRATCKTVVCSLSLSFSLPLSMSEHEGRMLIREIESMLRSLVGCSLTSNNNGTLGSSASAWYFAYCSYYLTAVELRWMFWQCATVRRAFDSVDGNHGQNANQCENVVCHGPDRTRSGNNQNVRASAIWTTNNTIFWRR